MEKLIIPELPGATGWRAWKSKVVHAVVQGSGRAEQGMVTNWVMEAFSKTATTETLRHCPLALVSLDGKLMQGINIMLKASKHARAKLIEQNISLAMQEVLENYRSIVGGRHGLWVIAKQFITSGKHAGTVIVFAVTDPDAGKRGVAPPPGTYRCRTVKLGSQGGEDGLGYVVYGWFECEIERTPNGLRLVKTTGSQRTQGLLYPDMDRRLVYIGAQALSDAETGFPAYGDRPERDQVGVLERIGQSRWRLVLPWPKQEAKLELLEIRT